MKQFRDQTSENGAELLRRVAVAGPGYLGVREPPDESTRVELAKSLAEAGLDVPAFLTQETTWVERRAKLFEAGEYPDKGITVTTAHLERLEERFDLPVPVLIEHAESPLELGYLTRVEHEGNELFGYLAITQEAHELIERSDAKSLSLGLESDLSRICEVSLVRNPRVADARIFTSVRFHTTLDQDRRESWKQRYFALEQQVRQTELDRRLTNLLEHGKILPAQVPALKELLSQIQEPKFGEYKSVLVSKIFALLESAPANKLFAELAPGSAHDSEAEAALLQPEEADFYRRYFPDINLREIAQVRHR